MRTLNSAVLLTATLAVANIKGASQSYPENGPVIGTVAATLDSLIPEARGLFLAEVTAISEHDLTPTDGPRYQAVALRSIAVTGDKLEAITIVRQRGGPPLPWEWGEEHPAPPPRFSVGPDAFKVGKIYWFAAASRLPRYPETLVGYWPIDSVPVGGLFERAIEQDAYRWHPEVCESRLTIGWIDADSAHVRLWEGSRLLWERQLDGPLTHRVIEAWGLHRASDFGPERPPGFKDEELVLLAETRTRLDSTNVFQLPPGEWCVQHYVDARSGRDAASCACECDAAHRKRVFLAYDRRQRLILERINDIIDFGGKAVGGRDERWVRRVDRWIDPRTGRTRREVVKRWVSGDEGHGSNWLPVDRTKGLAAGPLRQSSDR